MKILNIEQIREADNYTINNEPISSIDLMERASQKCTNWILENFCFENSYKIFVGPGNNGGDGLAIARLLSQEQKDVRVYVVMISSSYSSDFIINLRRLEKQNVIIKEINSIEDFPHISNTDIVIDAIFGSGLSRAVSGIAENIIKKINQLQNTIISIDIPSGLFGEDNRQNSKTTIVKADYTLTFQFSKLAFMFAENSEFVGDWQILDIGLNIGFTNSVLVDNYFTSKNDVRVLSRNKFSHKGTFGHALLISGSYGKMGAAILASKSCLRSGVGLLTSYIPQKGYKIMQTSTPETMLICDKEKHYISEIPTIDTFSAIGIGPGLGLHKQTIEAVSNLVKNCRVPLIIDADGLNILAKNKELYKHLPENTILTPHPKEFERLFGKSNSDFDRYLLQKEVSKKYKIIIVLKGSHTSISLPNGDTWFNSTGNPGMATAGSGDVLTGIILSLLAQGYKPEDAAKTGVYIHGLAGDFALNNQSIESLIASDIIDNLGNAFNFAKK